MQIPVMKYQFYFLSDESEEIMPSFPWILIDKYEKPR